MPKHHHVNYIPPSACYMVRPDAGKGPETDPTVVMALDKLADSLNALENPIGKCVADVTVDDLGKFLKRCGTKERALIFKTLEAPYMPKSINKGVCTDLQKRLVHQKPDRQREALEYLTGRVYYEELLNTAAATFDGVPEYYNESLLQFSPSALCTVLWANSNSSIDFAYMWVWGLVQHLSLIHI